MKQFSTVSVVSVLLLFGLCSKVYSEIDSLDAIIARGRVIYLAVGENNPPYLFKNNGQWQGKELSLLEKIAGTFDLPWEVRICPSEKEAFFLLEKNEGDILVSGRHINLIQGTRLGYSIAYETLKTYLVVSRNLLTICPWSSSDTLAGFLSRAELARIGVSRFSFARGACFFLDSETVLFDDADTKFRALLQGELDACIFDETEYHIFFQQHPEYLLFYRGIPVNELTEQISLAVFWRNKNLLRVIDAVIRTDTTLLKDSE